LLASGMALNKFDTHRDGLKTPLRAAVFPKRK
jgi:hypothetical protein